MNGISFELKGGESLGIVGHTGSGKSTIIRMLYRFYDMINKDADEEEGGGKITIDGQDITKLTLKDLRS